jgi:hypothetical protein
MTTDKKTTPGQETSFASKLELFKLYCTLQGLHLDAGLLKHQFATAEGKFDTADLNQSFVGDHTRSK